MCSNSPERTAVARGSRLCRALVLAAYCSLAYAGVAAAQASAWPAKPIRVIISWPPGGNADSVGRLLTERLSKSLGQAVVVDNRPGAGGTIGTQAVVLAEPDGHTLLFAAPAELSIVAATVKTLAYDPIKDLQPISQVMRGPYVLVANPAFPPNTLAELVAYAKANPGKVNYASFGNNTSNHLYGEMLRSITGIDTVHVPYKGGPPAVTDLLGGQVHYMFENVGGMMPLVRAGKLKALAVMAPQRLPGAPTVPTLAESGADMGHGVWLGLLAPAKTARPIVEKLHSEVVAALASPELRKAFEERSIQPVGSSPEEFARLILSETVQWRKLVEKMGLKQ
jgi:tripartite-type tricarboxylate transporter receptor subunit TctC